MTITFTSIAKPDEPCAKCGKRASHQEDRLKQCYCGARGRIAFFKRFPEYSNVAPTPLGFAYSLANAQDRS